MAQPYSLPSISHTRGDVFAYGVSLVRQDGTPATVEDVQALRAAYPTIEAAFVAGGTTRFTLTAAAGGIHFEDGFLFPDGSTRPALVLRATPEQMNKAETLVFDVQFSGPNAGPYTWLSGKITVRQDVTP